MPEVYRTHEQFAALGSTRSPWAPIGSIQQRSVGPHLLHLAEILAPPPPLAGIQQRSVGSYWLDSAEIRGPSLARFMETEVTGLPKTRFVHFKQVLGKFTEHDRC